MPGGVHPTAALAEAETTIEFALDTGNEIDVYRALADTFSQSHPDIHIALETSTDWNHEAKASESDCFVGYTALTGNATDHLLALRSLVDVGRGNTDRELAHRVDA